MTLVSLGAWFLSASWFGFAVARLALRAEPRIAVLAAYGVVAGHSLQSVLLILLWSPLPIQTSFWLVVAFALLAGTLLQFRTRELGDGQTLEWRESRGCTLAFLALLAFTTVASYASFRVGISLHDPELLFFHSAVTERMTFESYPPSNPLEPDEQLRYRFGYHTLAAAILSQGDDSAPQVLAYLTALLVSLLPVSLYAASRRAFGVGRFGVLASILGLLGGSLAIVYEVTRVALHGAPLASSIDPQVISGVTWFGNTFDMIHTSPTVALGFISFAIALWLCTEALDGPRSLAARFMAVAALAYLGLVNEVYFSLLVGGLLAASILQTLRETRPDSILRRLRPIISCTVLVAASFALVLARGGLSGGIALFGAGAGSLKMVLNTEHFGQLPGPPSVMGEYWLPLLSVETMLDTLFAPVLLPALLAVAISTRSGIAQRAAFSATLGFGLWLTLYPSVRPADGYRFGQAAMSVFLCTTPIILAPVWRQIVGRWSLIGRIWPSFVALLVAPHLALATVLTFVQPPAVMFQTDGPDAEAGVYLRRLAPSARVLVPLDPPERGDVMDLYAPTGPGAAARHILALSGVAVPMGHSIFFNKDAYTQAYQRAGASLAPADLAPIKVQLIYLMPSRLSDAQRLRLSEERAGGHLALEKTFGAEGTDGERLLFRVVAKSDSE